MKSEEAAVALVEREPCTGELAMNLKLPRLHLETAQEMSPHGWRWSDGNGRIETDIHTNIFIKSSLLNEEDFKSMHGNT